MATVPNAPFRAQAHALTCRNDFDVPLPQQHTNPPDLRKITNTRPATVPQYREPATTPKPTTPHTNTSIRAEHSFVSRIRIRPQARRIPRGPGHPHPAQQPPTNTQPATAPQYREPATAHKPITPTHTHTQSPVPGRQLSSMSRTSAPTDRAHSTRPGHLTQQQPLNQQHPAGSYPSNAANPPMPQPATTHERSTHDHQYSAGSFPSMSRTWVRAQVGHSQLCPRRSFSMTQANASTGGAPALERPQRAHSAPATSETGGLSTM